MTQFDAFANAAPAVNASRRGNTTEVHLTEAELAQRVDAMVDEAIMGRDAVTLRRIAVLMGASIKLSTAKISVKFADDARLSDATRWLIREYKDLVVSGRVLAACVNYPPREVVAVTCERAIAHLGLPITLSTKQTNDTAHRTLAGVTVHFEFMGTSLAAAVHRLKSHVRGLAQERYKGTTSASWANEVKVRQFLHELVEKSSEVQPAKTPPLGGGVFAAAQEPAPQGPAPDAPRSVQPEASSSPARHGSAIEAGPFHSQAVSTHVGSDAGHALAPDVSEALAKRIELLRRRTGAQFPPLSVIQHSAVSKCLSDAMADGDPLDIAALAVILYDAGLSVRMDRFFRTPFDGKLAPGSSPLAEALASGAPRTVAPPAQKAASENSSPAALPFTFDEHELLTCEELSVRIKYDVRTIRDRLKDTVFVKDVHYVRPFGGRKILFRWGVIARELGLLSNPELADEVTTR